MKFLQNLYRLIFISNRIFAFLTRPESKIDPSAFLMCVSRATEFVIVILYSGILSASMIQKVKWSNSSYHIDFHFERTLNVQIHPDYCNWYKPGF